MLSNIGLKYIHLISLSLFNSPSQKFQHLENFLWRLDYLWCTYIISYFVVKLVIKLLFLLQSDDASKQSNRGLEKEKQDREEEKKSLPLEEKHPSLQISGLSLAELQVMHSVRKSILVEDKMWQFSFIYYFSTLRPVVFMFAYSF